ncbi:MAG TPA: dTMP kinase [Alphaproteobacteria bacterium]|nr:dTMP kinase [Alphaproteobacteria bacterium]HQS93409.1 dTMP kinase [Alphaproteobacteria bacterium]
MSDFKSLQVPQGIFLTFEGGEGTGKSTQIRKVSEWLRTQKIPVVITREPGGTPGAEEIRNLLVQGNPERWDAMTEALLLFAARRDHVEFFIKPHLKEGTWVLCDRFTDSSWVYQGFASGLGPEKIEDLAKTVLNTFEPNVTIILDLPSEVGLARAHARATKENRFEKKGLVFHKRLQEGYHLLAQKNPERCFLVSGLGSEEEVFDRLLALLKDIFPSLKQEHS